MISKARRKGTIRFAIRPAAGTRAVCLVGESAGWEPGKMPRQKDGLFDTNIEPGPGRHEHRFIVDGHRALDPDSGTAAMKAYGSFDSVVEVS